MNMGNTMMPMNSTHMHMGGMNSTQCMKHKMWTYFHLKPDDTILFDFWGVSNAGEMIWSSLIIFVMACIPEFIKYLRWRLEQNQHFDNKTYRQKLFAPSHLLQTLLFGLQLAFSYILMLCFMTFNVWLCIAVVAGMTISYLSFGSRQERHDDDDDDVFSFSNKGTNSVAAMGSTESSYIFSCLAVVTIAFAYELIKFGRTKIDNETEFHDCCDAAMRLTDDSEGGPTKLPFERTSLTQRQHVASCITYFIQTFGAYCLMMISMTYNVPIILSMLLGHMLAFFLLGPLTRPELREEEGDCCG